MNIPLNIDWQQILLHFFNFSILVGGLYLLLQDSCRIIVRLQRFPASTGFSWFIWSFISHRTPHSFIFLR